MSSSTIKIGFTGHIDTRDQDTPIIKIRIREKLLQLLQEYSGKKLVIISGNAKGADELLIQVLKELNSLNIDRDDIDKKVDRLKSVDLDGNEVLEPKDKFYKRQAEYVIEHAEVLIAIWNGIFNYKLGGTSDIVKKALEKNLTIHHLITPRQSNHIPVNSLAKSAVDYDSKQFTRIPFTVNFTWQTVHPKIVKNNPKQKVYNEYKLPFLFNYVIPIGLALLTLILGWVGFVEYNTVDDKKYSLNNLFKALNLITLNNSVLDQPSNTVLDIARCSGLITLIYAFVYGLILAFGRHRQNFKRRLWKSKGFTLVLGLNEKSISLIKSLIDKKEKVVLLTEYENSIYDNELKRLRKLITVRGSLSSATMLEYVYAVSAKEIYIVSDNDSKNVRAAQELNILLKEKKSDKPQIFVHLMNDEHNKFLRDSIKHIGDNTTIFNIYENVVRRLFLHFPPDRFYQSPKSDVLYAIILGLDDMGKELVQNLLKQGHYQKDKQVKILVYCNQAEDCQKNFENQNPLFFTNDKDALSLKEIKSEVWKNISLSFMELPLSDAEWLDDEQPLYSGLSKKHIVSIYTGLNNGIYAASYLKSILPKLNKHKRDTGCDIQVFPYYNSPDRKEESHIETYLNEIAPELFVKCFGNFVDECGVDTVKSMTLDEMGKLINTFYFQPNLFEVPIDKWKGIDDKIVNECWFNLSAKDRMSSQQAGDHLWVKLRILNIMKGWNFDTLNYFLDDQIDLPILGEIEHRRWSAELLLQGFVPFRISTESDKYTEYVEQWNSKKVLSSGETFKAESQLIKRHINLVPFDKLEKTESDKDYNQINTIPYFLKQMLPMVFEQIIIKTPHKIQIINSNPNLAYLLLYSASIDNNISEGEKELIRKSLNDAEQWQNLMTEFEKMNEKERAERVMNIIMKANEADKNNWRLAIKELMKIDGRFSTVEQYFIELLKK